MSYIHIKPAILTRLYSSHVFFCACIFLQSVLTRCQLTKVRKYPSYRTSLFDISEHNFMRFSWVTAECSHENISDYFFIFSCLMSFKTKSSFFMKFLWEVLKEGKFLRKFLRMSNILFVFEKLIFGNLNKNSMQWVVGSGRKRCGDNYLSFNSFQIGFGRKHLFAPLRKHLAIM